MSEPIANTLNNINLGVNADHALYASMAINGKSATEIINKALQVFYQITKNQKEGGCYYEQLPNSDDIHGIRWS